MFIRRLILSAVWLFPLATMALLSHWQMGSPPTLENIPLWMLLGLGATWLIIARWNRQWAVPSAWGWSALCGSVCLGCLGIFLKDGRLAAMAMAVHCLVWASSHFERVRDRTTQRPHTMLSYLPILIALLVFPNDAWNPIEDWQWSWFSDCVWPIILLLEIPFLISESGVEFTQVSWSRQTIFGSSFSVSVHVAMCMLWLGLARRPVWLAPAYAVAAVLWAFLTNFLRFAFMAWLITWAETDGYQGWLLYVGGSVTILGSLMLFIATDKLMVVVLAPIFSVHSSKETFNPLIDVWNCYLSIDSQLFAERQKR